MIRERRPDLKDLGDLRHLELVMHESDDHEATDCAGATVLNDVGNSHPINTNALQEIGTGNFQDTDADNVEHDYDASSTSTEFPGTLRNLQDYHVNHTLQLH
jgi:hypothetical protein